MSFILYVKNVLYKLTQIGEPGRGPEQRSGERRTKQFCYNTINIIINIQFMLN